MTLQSLLNLDKTENSIPEIEAFLRENQSEQDRLTAESFYADILFEMGSYEGCIPFYQHIMESLKNRIDDPRYAHALDKLIKISTKNRQFSTALNLIEKRKNTLPILKRYQYFLDLIELKKAQNEPYNDLMDRALEEVIPDSVKSMFMLEKLNTYVLNQELDLALKTIFQLRVKRLEPNVLHQIELIELDILLKQKAFDLVYEKVKEKTDLVYDFYHLSALIGLEKYRQASVYEVEHEHRFGELDDEQASKIYTLILSLYDKLNDKISIEAYQKKLKALKKTIKPKTESVIPQTRLEDKQTPKIEIKEKVIELNKVTQSIEFEKIAYLLQFSLNLSPQKTVREKLRLLLIEAEKMTQFKEIVIYIYPHTLYHYKKERLYDKPFLKEDYLKSVIYTAYDRKEPIIEDTELIRWDIDLLTGLPYDQQTIKKIFAYPASIGVLAFYQSHTQNPMFFDDFYSLLSILIFNIFTKEEEKKTLDHQKRLFQSVYQSDLMAYRIIEEDLMRFNKMALNIFDYPKHTPIHHFIQDLSGDDQIRYKQFLSKLDQKGVIEYTYKDYLIEETAVPFKIDDQTIILSAFKDITRQKKSEKDWANLVIIDQRTGIQNKFAFESRVEEYFKGKTTFLLIELRDLDLLQSLYGLPMVEKYFNAFIDFSKAYFDAIYLFDVNKIMAIINANDIRTIEKSIKTYEQGLLESMTPMPNQHYRISAGVIRFPINTTETKLDKFYSYISLALEKASRKKHKGSYAYFDYQDYKEEQFEISLIEHMDQAITNETLDVQFSPIVHLSSNKVFSYLVSPYLPELAVDSSYYALIAQKRLMTERFDKYLLKTAFKTLNKLESTTSKYVRLTIEISEETLKLKEFNAYLIGLFKQYDLPYSICSILIKSKDLQDVDFLKLKELFDLGIHITVTQFEYMVKDIHFVYLREKFQLDSFKVYDYLMAQKDYATTHGIGLIFEHLDESFQKKLKPHQAIYHIDRKKVLSLNRLIDMIGGVK